MLFVLLYMQLIYGDTNANRGIAYPWFFFLGDLPRDLMLLLIAAFVVRDILHPEFDVVRSGGDDDPAGGVLDGAEDRFVPRLPFEDDAESWWIDEPDVTASAESSSSPQS